MLPSGISHIRFSVVERSNRPTCVRASRIESAGDRKGNAPEGRFQNQHRIPNMSRNQRQKTRPSQRTIFLLTNARRAVDSCYPVAESPSFLKKSSSAVRICLPAFRNSQVFFKASQSLQKRKPKKSGKPSRSTNRGSCGIRHSRVPLWRR